MVQMFQDEQSISITQTQTTAVCPDVYLSAGVYELACALHLRMTSVKDCVLSIGQMAREAGKHINAPV